jgi:hypothetical protein
VGAISYCIISSIKLLSNSGKNLKTEKAMVDFYDCVLLKHGLAWGVGAGIFLITIFLVARKIIGFWLSLILMLIALGASMAIEHRDQTIAYWNKKMPETLRLPETAPSSSPTEIQKSAPAGAAKRPTPITTPTTEPLSPEQHENPNLKGQSEKQKQRLETFTPP